MIKTPQEQSEFRKDQFTVIRVYMIYLLTEKVNEYYLELNLLHFRYMKAQTNEFISNRVIAII